MYPPSSIIARLRQLLDRGGHPLESHFSFHALLGFLPLPKYHLVIVNKKHKVGAIAQRWVYGISEWQLFPLQYVAKGVAGVGGGGGGRTSRYRELVEGYIDLSKDFFFSYYYDLTHSLQHNLTVGERDSRSGGSESGQARRDSGKESERAGMLDERKQKEAAEETTQLSTADSDAPSASGSMVKSASIPAFPSRSGAASSLSSNSSLLTDVESTLSDLSDSPSKSNASARPTTPLSTALPDGSNPWADLDTSFAAAANAPAAHSSPLATPRSGSRSSPLPGPTSPSSRSTPYLPPLPPRVSAYADQWLWNFYPAHTLLSSLPLSSYWLVPLVHGFFQQQLLRVGHLDLLVTLLARRSRHYAGTRYIKRGIEARGHVANEVESEQIIECIDRGSAWFSNSTSYSSVVILRGSIPLYWWQENVHTMKPNVVIATEQDNYTATRQHFDDLRRRYGDKIDILSLIKKEEKNPQEMRLGYAFTAAVATLREAYKAEEVKLEYQTYDFLNMRHAKANVLRDVRNLVAPAVDAQGVFSHVNVIETEEEKEDVSSASDLLRRERRHVSRSRQTGVVRINCVDCLDRTNVAMFCTGKAAMKRQLQALGLLGAKGEKVWPELVLVLQRFYTQHGDRIAQQYAGSGAMHREALYDKGQEEGEVDTLDNNDLISGPSGGVGQATRDRLTDEHNRDVAAERDTQRTSAPTAERAPKQKPGAGMAHNAISFAKRYYSNNVTDVEKQQAINVFLGHFIPPADPRSKQVWDCDPNTALHEFDQRLAQHGDNEPLFYPPYNPNCLVPVKLAKRRARPTVASPAASAATGREGSSAVGVDGGGSAQLGALFSRFYDEKYNPTKLTSLDAELSKQYARPLYVGQPLLEVKEARERDSRENKTPVSVGSTGSVEPSPLISSMSTSYSSSSNVPSLPLLDEAEVSGGPMSPSPRSRVDSGNFELGPNARTSPAPMYNTPPHSPSPHSLSRHNSIDQPSPVHTFSPPSPLQYLPPPNLPIATPVAASSGGDAFNFNLSSGVVTAAHPGHKTGLAQANAVANKVGAATKSFFTKGLKTAFGANRGAVGGAGVPVGADKHLHRVRSSGNVHAAGGGGGVLAMPVAAGPPSLSASRSVDFNFLDAGTSVTLAHAHVASSNSVGPMSPTGTNSPRKGLPPQHGNLPSSSSFTANIPPPPPRNGPLSPIAAIPRDLNTGLTAFHDLLGGANITQPFVQGQDSPRHLQTSKAEAEEKVPSSPAPPTVTVAAASSIGEDSNLPLALVISPRLSVQMYEDRVFVARNDEDLFNAYVDTQRLCQLAHNTTPWTDTWQLQVATSPKGDGSLSPRSQFASPLTGASTTPQQPQQPSTPLLLTSPSLASTGPSISDGSSTASTDAKAVSSVSQQLASELRGDVNLVTSTIPSAVNGVRSVEQNERLEAVGVDALAESTEVPGESDEAAVAKLAGEIE